MLNTASVLDLIGVSKRFPAPGGRAAGLPLQAGADRMAGAAVLEYDVAT